MNEYQSFNQAYNNSIIKYKTIKSSFPQYYKRWRANPLSEDPIVSPNIAGFLKYPIITQEEPTPIPEFQHKYNYVCSTIFPQNPLYVETKQIITQP